MPETWRSAKIFLFREIGKIFAVFSDADGFEPSAALRFLANQSIENIKQMRSQSFRRTIFQNVWFEQVRERGEHFQPFRIGFRKHARMIEIFRNPAADKFDASEIDDKTELVQLLTRERECQRPIVPVHKTAMSRVQMLQMPDRDIRINFFASMHTCGEV